ncbi:unnamed protein product [Calypogeia fissa]
MELCRSVDGGGDRRESRTKRADWEQAVLDSIERLGESTVDDKGLAEEEARGDTGFWASIDCKAGDVRVVMTGEDATGGGYPQQPWSEPIP